MAIKKHGGRSLKKLIIRLNIDGKKRKFKASKFVSSEVFRRTLELEDDLNKGRDPYMIFNKCYPLICEIFGNKFTSSQLQKAVDIRDILPLAYAAIDHVIEQMRLRNKLKEK